MGDPYLSSDESLILSTYDIRINGISFDLMLTSRRLILIDNSVTPFHIRTIPLETIITAVAGIDVNGDPILTLSHMDLSGIGAPKPMDFIFTRKEGKQRATECNEWAATLSDHASEARNEALSAGTLPYDAVKAIQPRMSATYRIEMFSPRKPVKDKYPVRVEPEYPEPEITPIADINPIVPVIEEPVSPEPEIIPEADTNPIVPVEEEPVSLEPEIIPEADINPTVPVVEEPAYPEPEIIPEADINPTVPVVEEPAYPEPEIIPEADINPTVPVVEEPAYTEPEITPEADKNPVVPVVEELVSPESEIIPEADTNLIVSVEEPVSLESEIIPEADTNLIVSVEEPVSLESEIIPEADINLIVSVEEPVSLESEIIPEADINPVVPVVEELVSPESEIIPEADINPVVPVVEELVSPESEIIPEADKNPIVPVEEGPVSSMAEIPHGEDENPANTDAAQAWADAVRTVTTPSPVNLPVTAIEPIPTGEIFDNEPKTGSDQIHSPVEEPVAEIKNDDISNSTTIPEFPADEKVAALPLPETAPAPAELSPPVQKIQKSRSPFIPIAAIIVIILVVFGVAVLSSFTQPGSGDSSPPVVVPNVTDQPAPVQLQTLVPTDGVWVRIEYPGTYIGEAGNPGFMHPVSGSGVQIYKILWRDRIIQASAQKQDYSGDTLTLEVYNNGILIKRSSTRIPMGSVSVLIDPITGEPAGSGYGNFP